MSAERHHEKEGVIQFSYDLDQQTAREMADELPSDQLAILNHWRHRMIEQKVLGGGEVDRYNGLGYGNLSVRRAPGKQEFLITASQTGGMRELDASEYVLITQVDLASFSAQARGTLAPSSETLTHAMIYQGDPGVNLVLHAHAPVLWKQADALQLPVTPRDVGYGSPEMARCVTKLVRQSSQRPNLFITLGHQDGVFAYGIDAEETGVYLLEMLALAEGLQQREAVKGEGSMT